MAVQPGDLPYNCQFHSIFPLQSLLFPSMSDSFSYYRSRLAAEKLKICYAIAAPRVRQYLEAEIQHVLAEIAGARLVLELGCGYGRVLKRLAPAVPLAVGIDNSLDSLLCAAEELAGLDNCRLLCMDAAAIAFRDDRFDCVICIQNGISAFHVDRLTLMSESLRVCRPGGFALFSSYSPKFWEHRLEWFEQQSAHGLLGPIDYARTGNGSIVCTDGFTASTCTPDEFRRLAAALDTTATITEIDDSSIFCRLLKP